MEISINLLPQTNNKKEKSSVFLIPVLGIITLLAATSFLIYTYFSTKDSVAVLTEEIALETTKRDELLSEYQQQTTGVTEYNFTEKYRAMDQVLNTIYVSTTDLHGDVLELLPEKAEVNAYSFLNNGDLLLTVTFFSKGDSAIYLHRLLSADFVDQAEVQVITADDEELTYKSIFQIKLNTLGW